MAKTKARKTYQKKYRKDHPEYDRNYRERHQKEIAEYKRLNPDLRFRVPLQDKEELEALFGDQLFVVLKGLIRKELLHRSE